MTGRREIRVPTRWVKFLIGIFLLPVCGITTVAFFHAIARDTIEHGFWLSEEFWFFSIGAIVWALWFVGLPKPVMLYVFGHELTHAIWVWLMGGRVTHIEFGEDGGEIVTTKSNFLIALAPYFFPLYSVLVLAIYGMLGAFSETAPLHRWMLALLGATWSFHMTFTFWMIPKQQTDLVEHGTFFSIVVIYLMNLIVLCALYVVASPESTWAGFARQWSDIAETVSVTIIDAVTFLGDWLLGFQI
jgi:hypothetical protein